MDKKKDYFTPKWQINARKKGRYDEIAKNVSKCVFCDLKDKYIIAEKSGIVLTVNIFPYTTGHLMVIPRRHVENYLDLTQKEIDVCQRLLREGLRLLHDRLDIKSVWFLLREGPEVGKTVKHLHWQIMPFVEGLVKWNYQEIEIAPEELAKVLRKKDGIKKKNKKA